MLPTSATAVEQVVSTVATFGLLMVVSSFIGFLAAHALRGKSHVLRQAAFGAVTFIGICASAVYSFSQLR